MANSKRNYRIFIFTTILLISGSILPAQDPGPPKWWDENLANDVDARSRRIASAMIIGVAHQDIKTMAIPFLNTQDIGIGISVEEAVAQQASEAVLSIAIQGTTGISASLIAKEIATYAFGATAGTIAYQATPYIAYVYALYEILKADHVQFRTYSFYAPITGNYNITCDMPGDIDYPRNRVRLYTGTTALLDWEERWSSSRKKTFQINLTPGFYTLSVGLGSGTSVGFHNSGTLYSLYFSETSAVRWDAPVVLSQTSYRLLDSLPSIGSRTALRTTWNGSYVNPYIIDG